MMSNAFEFDLAGGRLSGQKFYFAPIADSGPLAQQAAEEEEEIDNAGFERPAIFGISSSSGTRRLIQEPPLKRAQPPRLIRPPPLKRSLISRDLLSRWSSDEQPGVANALYY
ncbi:hypothetical protein M3Y94_00329000 [Aphelenchoides besseyi]|nr:hypothetical protein M3Y94_00329000 [Aphelenchoides besseyi]